MRVVRLSDEERDAFVNERHLGLLCTLRRACFRTSTSRGNMAVSPLPTFEVLGRLGFGLPTDTTFI